MGGLIPLADVVRCRRCGRWRLRTPTNSSFCRSCWRSMAARFNSALEPAKRALAGRSRGEA
ncbi:MAG: hypothetical protein RDU89_10915 [bacterium]|nr:hypothetical protein [bacterium]